MAPRANWKGYLKVAELSCPVALHTAASTSERVAFHFLNRATHNRLRREFVDSETGDVVEREDQVKGYESDEGGYAVLEPEEVAAAVPQNDRTLAVSAFIPLDGIDDLALDRPYYLTPAERHGEEVYALIREGLRARGVAALAEAVLFRRVRTLLVRPEGPGLIATTLHFDYELRSARRAFSDIPDLKIEGEMLELAEHIIRTKAGTFDPSRFDDRYDAALAELVKAKMEGRKIAPPKAPKREQVVSLLDALRRSAGKEGEAAAAGRTTRRRGDGKAATSRRKAG
jgi:DNA end-binding protein Ku